MGVEHRVFDALGHDQTLVMRDPETGLWLVDDKVVGEEEAKQVIADAKKRVTPIQQQQGRVFAERPFTDSRKRILGFGRPRGVRGGGTIGRKPRFLGPGLGLLKI